MNTSKFDIEDLLKLFWSKKILLTCFASVGLILSAIYSLNVPNKYTSSVLIISVDDSFTNSNLSRYSGLANLAGLSIPSESDKSTIGLEVLRSRLFIENFIKKHDILPELMASKDWNIETNEIIYDNKIYDNSKKIWTRKANFPKKSKPSFQEGYDFWKKNIFSMIEDKQTGLVKFEIEHHSPIVAQEWASLLISDLNNFIRDKDILEAEMSIEYLNNESSKTNIEELRSLFYKLIQSNIEKKMLAYARSEYLFQVIDPPIVSEEKSSPQRVLLIILGSILGIMLGTVTILISHFIKER